MSLEYLNYIAGISRGKKLARNKKNKNDKKITKGEQNLTVSNKVVLKTPAPKPIKRDFNDYHKSILIAESDKAVNSIFSMYANAMGYDYEIVENGVHVLEKAANGDAKNQRYDVIIIDTHLDEIPGLKVAEEIHKNDLSQRIIIISHSEKKDLNVDLLKRLKLDEGDIFTKPFRLSDLFYSIDKRNY